MKKLILVLAIALVSCPAIAALDVNLVAVDSDTVSVVYSGADVANLPRAFALTIQIDGTGVFTAINGYKTGESTSGSKGFGIYPARIVIDSTGAVTSYGNPLADVNDPGAAGTGLGTATVILEFGSLYFGDVNAPATSGTLCTLDFTKGTATQITLADELTYRGGIVLEDGTQVDDSALYLFPADGLYVGQTFACGGGSLGPAVNFTVTQLMVDKWNYLGQPKCWTCAGQKCGNGVYAGASANRPDSADFTSMQGAWFKQHTQAGYQPCSDFNLSGRIDSADFTLLQGHWFKAVGGTGCY